MTGEILAEDEGPPDEPGAADSAAGQQGGGQS
jgi:hypothetical protein